MSDRILICGGTGCIASNSRPVMASLEKELEQTGLNQNYQLIFTGCQGFCEQGPIIIVEKDQTFYCRVDPDQVPAIVQNHLQNGQPVEQLLYVNPDTGIKARTREEVGFFHKQKRLVLHNCGLIDPENINEYITRGGYKTLEKALKGAEALNGAEPQQIIDQIKQSGLRGRGGGGFPTGIKWETTKNAVGEHKYLICNADEGDPGAFMDRSIMEGDPHSVIEGMLIGGYAIGAQEGYIYIRAEYPLAVRRLLAAIRQAEGKGFLGDKILGSEFSFRIRVKQGAGAFVCGEETALIESIQGNRGMPRPRPPFPSIKGVWDMPTNVNNVETLANIPIILGMGAAEYAKIGTEQSKGTKIFALTGKINNTGLAEVPMGITLREIIYDIGGGIKDGKQFKAVQIGGPSGGCIPTEHLDVAIDYDSLISLGAMMGSGGLVVMDESTCMVDVARFFLTFTRTESCGKCTPCREGTKRLLEILERIVEGKGEKSDLETLDTLGRNVIDTSLCGLGQSAPNPILSTLRYFRSEYELHINQKVCPAGVCKALKHYRVIPEKCKACGLCKKECPVGAITGEKKVPHVIDLEKCAKCGECVKKCPFEAIVHG